MQFWTLRLAAVLLLQWVLLVPLEATCGGGGGGGRGGMQRLNPRGEIYWTRAAEAAKKAHKSTSGIVYCIMGDEPPAKIWTNKKLIALSRTVPFVDLKDDAGEKMAQSINLTARPAVILTDPYGNPIWGFGRKLSAQQISAGVNALGQATQALDGKLVQDLAEIKKATDEPDQRRQVIQQLQDLLRYQGYAAVNEGQQLYDSLLAEARVELDRGIELIDTDQAAAKKVLRTLVSLYPGTPIAEMGEKTLRSIERG